MTEPRVFTLEEANAALPRLRVLIAQQIERARELREVMAQARAARAEGRSDEAEAPRLRELMRAYDAGWSEVAAMGVVVKDPESGLCDFYGRVGGELVWLCWKYGEDAVTYYHTLDGGFAARKPLENAPTSRRMYN